ncbi:MAG: phosphomannomutase/phosphoglucomutase [Candidatus Falkowbacteria bacterium]
MSNINPNIFKAYDIRGLYPAEINEETAFKIAKALVEFLRNKGEINGQPIIVGRDARNSSDNLYEAVADGLVSEKADVIDINAVSTPLFYWAIINQKAAGGIMITASHNPAEYNGFKICRAEARSIGLGSGLAEIRELAKKERAADLNLAGKVWHKNLLEEYISFVKNKITVTRIKPLKIVVDYGNGIAGAEAEELFKFLPCSVESLFVEPDGNFPNHEADPIKEENLIILRGKLLSTKADLGIAFDGDGDRITFLDEKGELVRGDFITALIAQDLLKDNPSQKIFYEVRSSKVIPEIISMAGGVPILGRPGHSLIKERMRQENILFGGELSGHYFYKDFDFIENALFTMAEILRIISTAGKPFSEIVMPLKKYFTSGEINFKVPDADLVLKKIEQKFSDAQIKKIDGLTIIYSDWWFNLRKSNTEPLVRLNLEADTPELMEEKKKEVSDLIK